MDRPRGFPRSFRFPWRSAAAIRRDVDDELAFHLAAKAEALEREGLSAAEAREEALRQFGDLQTARERLVAEDSRGEQHFRQLLRLDAVARDVRMAWRSLRRTPGFTIVAILVLALGTGVVSGAFGLVNVLGLKPLLIAEPEEILGVFAVGAEEQHVDRARYFIYPEYAELRERVSSFSGLAAYEMAEVGVGEGDGARRVFAAFVSADYFSTLGVPPARGRAFTPGEERGEEPAVAVVSHRYWVRNGADPNVLGSVVRINGQPLTIVGVAARGFTGTTTLLVPDVWAPLGAAAYVQTPDGGEAPNTSLMLFGRLAAGASPTQAQAELAALAPQIAANEPRGEVAYTYVAAPTARISITPQPNSEEGFLVPAALLTAMSCVVLLIACLNLANMFLARGASRRTELAIRQSLGSGRGRLIRQLLTEGLLLAVLGGALGMLWAYAGIAWLAASLGAIQTLGIPLTVDDTRPDALALLVAAVTCGAATLLFALGPAWRVTGSDLVSGLKDGAGAVNIGSRRFRRLPSGRNLLIVAQIALSLVMLTAGGLFVRSALLAANATPGFDPDAMLLVALDPSLVGYDEPRSRAVYAAVIERLRALPEVEAAGIASLVPFTGLANDRSFQRAGLPPGESVSSARYSRIDDGYFAAIRAPLLRGRNFTAAEAAQDGGPRVAIVDELFARELFPDGTDALGRQIQIAARPGGEPVVMQIVGIAPGIAGSQLDPRPRPHVYVPFGQAYTSGMYVHLAVRATFGDEARLLDTVRNAIRDVDPALPISALATMRDFLDQSVFLWIIRVGAQLFTLLGALALFVALVGLYGVKAFLVARRTREIGVRMALGATHRTVLRQLMRESMTLTAAGLAIGCVLTLAAGQVLSSLLYEVSAADPWALSGASAFLALAATAAAWLPARKALRIEPIAALRYD